MDEEDEDFALPSPWPHEVQVDSTATYKRETFVQNFC